VSVTLTRDRLPELLRSVKELTKRTVQVGVPDEDADRKPVEGESEPITNAALAYIHENGVPEKNIPARPFMVPGIDSAKERITKQLVKAGEAMLDTGSKTELDKALGRVGLIAQSAIQNKITDGPFAPLAPKTIAERKARGNESDKPLIDTGQLRQAITFVIRDRGK
jgi:hypothetical protein